MSKATFAAALDAGPPARLNRCALCCVLDALPASEADALRVMLTDRSWSARAISEVCTQNGYPVTISQVGAHRRH